MSNVINNLINYLNDGITDSGILIILVLIDTTLGITYAIKAKKKLTSTTMLSGMLRNLILAIMPYLVSAMQKIRPRQDDLYPMLSVLLTLFIGVAIIQSILAYCDLWGIKFPAWLENFIKDEINSKANKNKSDNKSDNDSNNQAK